jgi:hypothetical protein
MKSLITSPKFQFSLLFGLVWLLYTKKAHYNEGCAKLNYNWIGVDLNLFKVLGHTWDPLGSPPGISSISTSILHQPQRYTELALWRVIDF